MSTRKAAVSFLCAAVAILLWSIFDGFSTVDRFFAKRELHGQLVEFIETTLEQPRSSHEVLTAFDLPSYVDIFNDYPDLIVQELGWAHNELVHRYQPGSLDDTRVTLANIEAWMAEELFICEATTSGRDSLLTYLLEEYAINALGVGSHLFDVEQALLVDKLLHQNGGLDIDRHGNLAERIWQEASTQARVSYFGYTPWFPKNHPLDMGTADSYFDAAMLQDDLEDARFIARVMKWDKFDERLGNLNEALMRRDSAQHLHVGMYESALEISLNPEAPEDLRAQAEELEVKTFETFLERGDAKSALSFAIQHNLPPAQRKLAEDLVFAQAAKEGRIGLARPLSDNGEVAGPTMLVVVTP